MTEDNERAWKELIGVSSEWTLRHKEAIIAVDLELKRILELEEALRGVAQWGSDCWCPTPTEEDETHIRCCQKARKALKIEVSAT